MKKLLCLFCFIFMLSLTAGCNKPNSSVSSDVNSESYVSSNTVSEDTVSSQVQSETSSQVHSQTESPETSSEKEQKEKDPVIKTMCTDEMKEGQFNKIYQYGTDEYESYILWCECDMTDVALYGIEYNEEGGFTGFTEPLYSVDIIKAGEAMQLDIMLPEGMPTSYLSYTAKGEKYEYVLSYNGRDGGMSLLPPSEL